MNEAQVQLATAYCIQPCDTIAGTLNTHSQRAWILDRTLQHVCSRGITGVGYSGAAFAIPVHLPLICHGKGVVSRERKSTNAAYAGRVPIGDLSRDGTA